MLTMLNRARYASQVASAWYDKLWLAYTNEEYKLHTNYNGLILSSIFDAKPVAYRARAVWQFNIALPPEQVYDFDGPDEWEDALHGYYQAYLEEKEAWSLYAANYCQQVEDNLRAGLDMLRNDGKYVSFEAGKLRVLEVKPCK